MHASSTPGQEWPTSSPQPNPWLTQLSRGSWLRGHISVFAIGSVALLTINLMRGSGGIWADTAISAWGVLLVAHGILMIIARLLQELLADEEKDGDIRPASEMRWSSPSTWSLPQRADERRNARETVVTPTPTLDADESAAAAAARERKPTPEPASGPEPSTEAGAPAPEADDTERVSWQAATDAAWLSPRDTAEKPGNKPDNEDDFTPLKFD